MAEFIIQLYDGQLAPIDEYKTALLTNRALSSAGIKTTMPEQTQNVLRDLLLEKIDSPTGLSEAFRKYSGIAS